MNPKSRLLLAPLVALLLVGAAAPPNPGRAWQALKREASSRRTYEAVGRMQFLFQSDSGMRPALTTDFLLDWRRQPHAFRLVMTEPGGKLYAVMNLNGDTLRTYNFKQRYVYITSWLMNFSTIAGLDFEPGRIGQFFFPRLPRKPDSTRITDSTYVFACGDANYVWDRARGLLTGVVSGSDTLQFTDFVKVGRSLRPGRINAWRGRAAMVFMIGKQQADIRLDPSVFVFGVPDTAKVYDLR